MAKSNSRLGRHRHLWTLIGAALLLTYSLGDVVQYVPAASAAPAGADAQGFVPASGGLAEGGLAQGGSADCSGPINRAGSEAGCTRQTFAESFWTTRAEESQ